MMNAIYDFLYIHDPEEEIGCKEQEWERFVDIEYKGKSIPPTPKSSDTLREMVRNFMKKVTSVVELF